MKKTMKSLMLMTLTACVLLSVPVKMNAEEHKDEKAKEHKEHKEDKH
jgi:hypothetical protein